MGYFLNNSGWWDIKPNKEGVSGIIPYLNIIKNDNFDYTQLSNIQEIK